MFHYLQHWKLRSTKSNIMMSNEGHSLERGQPASWPYVKSDVSNLSKVTVPWVRENNRGFSFYVESGEKNYFKKMWGNLGNKVQAGRRRGASQTAHTPLGRNFPNLAADCPVGTDGLLLKITPSFSFSFSFLLTHGRNPPLLFYSVPTINLAAGSLI